LAAKINKKELTDCLLGSREHKESEGLRIETVPSPVRSPSDYVCDK
jgi:hypothetical protein